MTDALRVYSDDMRHKRLSRAEEKAYSLPATLSVPLSGSRPSSERSDHLSLELAFCRGVVQKHHGQILVHTDYPSPSQHQIEILLPHKAA
jgi:hypothetical protein